MTIIRGSQVEPTPWANGGGWTRELYVSRAPSLIARGSKAPTESKGRWRLSMALVDGAGTFSSLPGVARSLVLVEGAVRLRFDGEDWQDLTSECLLFNGDTACEYIATEPSEDLGVMVWEGPPAPIEVVDVNRSLGLSPETHRAAVLLTGTATVGGEQLHPRDVVLINAPLTLEAIGRLALIGGPA